MTMKWIPVDQELPPKSDSKYEPIEHQVLLVLNGRQVLQGRCYSYSDAAEWRVTHVCGSVNDEVTHWMPQPTPPVMDANCVLTELEGERDALLSENRAMRELLKEVEEFAFRHLAVDVVMEGPMPYLKNKPTVAKELHDIKVKVDALLSPESRVK